MEIEARVKIDDLEVIKLELRKLGAIFSHIEVQEDTYFKKQGDTSKEGSFPLRIRKTPLNTRLTYKGLTDVDGAWIEHETHVGDHEQTGKILEGVGYVKDFQIHKEREHGVLGEINLCLDTIKDLGTFLEVEIICDDVVFGKKKLVELLEKLGFNEQNIIHRSYVALYFDSLEG